MSLANLAMVLGPCIVRSDDDSPEYLFMLPKVNLTVEGMIVHRDDLFTFGYGRNSALKAK